MQSDLNLSQTRLAPHWVAGAVAVSVLLGIWPCLEMLDAARAARDGLTPLILLPIVFIVVSLALVYPLLWLLRQLESGLARSLVCLLPFAAFLALRGAPHLFSLVLIGFAAAWTYRYVSRTHADAQDREEFNFDEKVRDIVVTPGFLQTFPAPLWDKLTLNGVRHTYGLQAIEGWLGGFQFMVLELAHEGWGFIKDHDTTVETTFFIVAIPKAQQGRVVSWQPADCDVSVDNAFAYLARPGEKVRPGEWQSLINKTIKVVESLKTREETPSQVHRPTFRPRGRLVVWFQVFFFLTGVVLVLAALWS